MKCAFVGLAVVSACLVPALASAQEAGKTGVTMSFPASVGIIHHVSGQIAVRPDFSFSWANTEAPGGETTSRSYGLGLSVLFYTKTWDNAAAYVAPRFAWSHSLGESRSDSGIAGSKSTADAFAYSGSIGAQGWIGSRVSVFGEVGVAFTHGTSETSLGTELKTKSFAVRSGIGAVLYF